MPVRRIVQKGWTLPAQRPDNPRAHYNLGNVPDRQQNLGGAIAQYTEALRLKPDYADATSSSARRCSRRTAPTKPLRISPRQFD
jgi:hypothetical protein